MFNSALDYELGVLKNYCKPLLKVIPPTHKHYNEARELLHFLRQFHGIPHEYVMMDSFEND